ncbi:MAG TPA: DoxX family protein [Candidatus Nanoarchaeia archaeon]|nr:DoxX family protein [Candidatus Nanoarchaeia archaeon]
MNLSDFFERNKEYGLFFTRVGIAAIFLWFGIDKFIHVQHWIDWVPDWMVSIIPLSLTMFMYVQGVIETLTGALLLTGYKTRFGAFLAALTLLGVIISMISTGQTEVMLRDIGLFGASLALLFTGSKKLGIDAWHA